MYRYSYLNAAAAIHIVVLGLLLAPTIDAAQCTLKPSAPRACGIRGHFNETGQFGGLYCPIYEPQFVSSLRECADMCARRQYNKALKQVGVPFTNLEYCSSFRYSHNTKLCQLSRCHHISSKKYVVPHKESKDAFFDLSCFQCPSICDQPYGNQLIDNGDFQQKLLGPWDAEFANIRKGYHSSRAFHCHAQNYNYMACQLSQIFNACQNETATYRFKFDYNVIYSPDDEEQIRFIFSVGDVSFYTITTNTNPDAWKTIIVYDRPQAYSNDATPDDVTYSGGIMEFAIYNGFDRVTGDFYLDNVHVSRVPDSPNLVKPQKSVIKNGGFESGDLLPWKVSSPKVARIVSPGINSKYAFEWKFQKQIYPFPFLKQNLTTKPNVTYLFSFDIGQISNKQDSSIEVSLNYPSGGSTYADRDIPAGTNMSFSFPVYSEGPYVVLTIAIDSGAPATVLWDNFKMLEIDQPEYFP